MIILSSKYPGQVAVDATNYPHGKARNVTVTGDGTGTPWEQDLVNDWLGFDEALVAAGSVTPSGNPDTAVVSQRLEALQALFAAKANQCFALGKRSDVFAFARTVNTYAAITNGDFDVANAAVGDIVDGEFYYGITLAAGACTIKLECNDNSTLVETYEYAVAAPGITYVFPFQYTIANAGTCGVVSYLRGDGTNGATVGNYYLSNNLYCRYRITRP